MTHNSYSRIFTVMSSAKAKQPLAPANAHHGHCDLGPGLQSFLRVGICTSKFACSHKSGYSTMEQINIVLYHLLYLHKITN